MLIQAQLEEIGERYVLRQIDGKGITLSTMAGEITGMLLAHHRAGALYGASPQEAFRVDVSDAVNPAAHSLRGSWTPSSDPPARSVRRSSSTGAGSPSPSRLRRHVPVTQHHHARRASTVGLTLKVAGLPHIRSAATNGGRADS